MPEATLKLVAKLDGVAPVTVSRVVNGSDNVAAATREKILAIIRDLDYTPNIHAASLRRTRRNDENISGSENRLAFGNEGLRAGCSSEGNMAWTPDGAFPFSPDERRALARQIIRLRRDLDRLRKHTERIQTHVDTIEAVYSR